MKKVNFMYLLVFTLMLGFNATAQDNPCPTDASQSGSWGGTEFKEADDGSADGNGESIGCYTAMKMDCPGSIIGLGGERIVCLFSGSYGAPYK